MFEITVRRSFSAAHAIVMRGVRERIHGHNWMVTVAVAGGALDADGLLCDFHALEGTLDDVLAPFRDRSLNDVQPFDRVNPTAENVAEYVALELAQRLPPGIRVTRVDVEEAPGCVAAYVAPRGAPEIEVSPGRDGGAISAEKLVERVVEIIEGGPSPRNPAGSRRG